MNLLKHLGLIYSSAPKQLPGRDTVIKYTEPVRDTVIKHTEPVRDTVIKEYRDTVIKHT